MMHTVAEWETALDIVREVREQRDAEGDEVAVVSLGHALDAILDIRVHLPAQR